MMPFWPIDLFGMLKSALGIVDKRKEVERISKELAEECRNEIARLAMASLHTTAEEYIAGLAVTHFFNYSTYPQGVAVAQVTLTGDLPNKIEHGWAGGDMKPALLNGSNAKVSASGGRYNVVPYRHMGPRSSGRNAQPMGSQFEALLGAGGAKQLGNKIWAVSKNLKGNERLGAGLAPLLLPHHKGDIFEGLRREQQKYKVGSGSQFKTFRAVSDKSDPQAWIHPGIDAHDFFPQAQTYIDRVSRSI